VGEIYNRLTLIEQYSHKEAIKKIHDDHKDLPGFSSRNIRRNPPKDNPIVPRRKVRSWCPKKKGNNCYDNKAELTSFIVETQAELDVKGLKQHIFFR
jgi:hypothetical protein